MTHTWMLTRRDALALMAASSSTAFFSTSAAAASHEADWDWLLGDWDVWHSRLKDRLVNSTEWQEFAGKSAFWRTLGGLGNVDDNSLDLPAGVYRGLSVRAFDAKAGSWAIWWVDGRNPERIDPPVRGGFKGDEGEFIGKDVHQGTPVTVRFRWHEVRSKRPWWDQSFSTDGGKTWETNWRNYFTRTRATATSLSRIESDPPETRAWDFLAGRWNVRNQKRRRRLAGNNHWDQFNSTLVNWQVLGGRGNVSDAAFSAPDAPYRGMSLRVYNDEKKEWLNWWLDGRTPADIRPPVRGRFGKDGGTLLGDDMHDGKPVKVRSVWSRTDTASPHWEQSFSADGGKTWELDWVADFTRAA